MQLPKRTYSLRKYIILIFIFILSIINAQKKFTIVLDAGHGGHDNGATRSYTDLGTIREKDVTLAITLKLGKMLEKDKAFKVNYTRKTDEYPTLYDRTNLANRTKADLFISIHVNANYKSTPNGTETYVQGPDQNRTNLEVAKAENDVIFLDEKDKQKFGTYDANSPESLIALKIQQSRYLESSLILGSHIEDNFTNKDKRYSRGVKQQNFHVLRMNAMPSVLVETGFVSNYEDAQYLASEKGQNEVAESIYNAIISYKIAYNKKNGIQPEPEKPTKLTEQALKNDFRVFLLSSYQRYNEADPALKGLKYILCIKEGNQYKYYYANTNFASVRDSNIKTAKDAGFKNAFAISFMPNQKLNSGYYTLEVAVVDTKLDRDSPILRLLGDQLKRNKSNGLFYYTYGEVKSLEEAIEMKKKLEEKGLKNTVIEKVFE